MTILNVYLLHKSCGGKMPQKFPQNPSARFDCTNARGQWRFSREAKFIWVL
jgi:hypothetical protein